MLEASVKSLHQGRIIPVFFMPELLAVVAGVFFEMGQNWDNEKNGTIKKA
jgi:hypothetical protein